MCLPTCRARAPVLLRSQRERGGSLPQVRASWLKRCVLAQRNYRFFLSFVFVTSAYDLYIHAWCWVWLAHLSSSLGISFADAISHSYDGPIAMALICYTVLAFV